MARASASRELTELTSLQLTALPGIPLIQPGDDLVALIAAATRAAAISPQAGDVFVISSKIVSKAEGAFVDLRHVVVSERAQQLATETSKEAALVELILRQSRSISRQAQNVLVVEHMLGLISANAGIDRSNVDNTGHNVLVLPADPDASAASIRSGLARAFDADCAIVISDSHGRPFRNGTVGVAIGASGLPPLIDIRGEFDLFGRELRTSIIGFADQIASAATLLSGEGAEGYPVVHIRGLRFTRSDEGAACLIRSPETDLYR